MNGTVQVLQAAAGSTGGAGTDTTGELPVSDGVAAVGAADGSLTSDTGGGSALAERVTVSIEGDVFPAVTMVTAGQTVTWINNDDVAHNVIARDRSFVSEKFMNPGAQFEHLFLEPGIYPYSCDLHPHMRGVIVVTAADESAGAGESPVVNVVDTGFEPADIVVHRGDTVRWEFGGVLPHTVTADDGSFDSGIQQPGGTFTFTFDTLGTFTYTCTLHPFMIGSVTVIPADEVIPDEVAGVSALSSGSGGAPGGETLMPASSESSSSVPMLLIGLLVGLALSIVVGIGLSIARGAGRSALVAT